MSEGPCLAWRVVQITVETQTQRHRENKGDKEFLLEALLSRDREFEKGFWS